MKVSVVMPVYNAEAYVEAAIKSVLEQTHRDFAFTIVNDGSTDGSAQILHRFAQQDSRINLIEQANQGGGPARNRGVEEASTRWVFQTDADDLMHPDRLERQLSFLQENPDVRVASCFGYYIDDTGRRVGRITHDLTTREKFEWYRRTNEAIGVMHPGVVFDRDTFMKVGGYRAPTALAEDIDLWNRMTETGALLLVQPEYLMDMHIHVNSAIGANFIKSRMKYEWVREMMRARRRGDEEPTWEEFLARWQAAPISARLNRWRKIEAKRRFRQAGMEWSVRHPGRAMIFFATATALQPGYSLRRLSDRHPWKP
jgi:glycosyltransferase involved in cell wall biosynthesis